MWKIFLVIATVTMLGAGALSYKNMKTAEEKRNDRIATQVILADREADLKETQDNLAMTNSSIAKLNDETEQLEGMLVQKQAMVTEAEAKLQAMNTQLEAAKVELAKAQEIEREFPNIEQLRQEMAQIRQQINQLGIEITALQNNVATAEVQRDSLEKVANELASLKDDQDKGRIRGPFASSVKRAYNNWGFVIIEGGNEQGVVNRAQLDVVRRGQQVCKLLVTAVEPGESVAEVIPGSLAPGQTVQQGDIVKKTDNPIQTPEPAGGVGGLIPQAAPEGGAPAGAPADPFSGFGDPGMGGAATPPAEAPAAPAGGAEPDPFQ
ncbi:hypothetical protein OAK81_01705 [Verrucomicrobiales bacterium]|nr:hypothetical protein [Verrucomicrobiales bacterium]